MEPRRVRITYRGHLRDAAPVEWEATTCLRPEFDEDGPGNWLLSQNATGVVAGGRFYPLAAFDYIDWEVQEI